MKRVFGLLCGVVVAFSAPQSGHAQNLILSQSEISAALSHGPWPLPKQDDPSNRMSGNAAAISLGKKLFSSKKLSADGTLNCASCHRPDAGFTDGVAQAMGHTRGDRNTQALYNLKYQRWFGWDGRNDNLWAQSLRPIVRVDEMALRTTDLSEVLTGEEFAAPYSALFGSPPQLSEQQNLVNVGKLLAAYIETLTTEKTPFDRFRDALAAGDEAAAAVYPEAAQRGFRIFAGKGKCNFCHTGALFSNGEFHDAGVPYFVAANRVDSGRHGGIKALMKNPYTLAGPYSDDPKKTGAWKTRQLIRSHNDFGTFRVPSLRNVGRTAPYMHNGSIATLEDVVHHYSNIDLERLHADGELILQPLHLTKRESADLVSFLLSLTEVDD